MQLRSTFLERFRCLAALFTPGLVCHRLQAPCIRTINRAGRAGLEGTGTHTGSLVTQPLRPALRNAVGNNKHLAQITTCRITCRVAEVHQEQRTAFQLLSNKHLNTDAIQAYDQLAHTQGGLNPLRLCVYQAVGPTHTPHPDRTMATGLECAM